MLQLSTGKSPWLNDSDLELAQRGSVESGFKPQLPPLDLPLQNCEDLIAQVRKAAVFHQVPLAGWPVLVLAMRHIQIFTTAWACKNFIVTCRPTHSFALQWFWFTQKWEKNLIQSWLLPVAVTRYPKDHKWKESYRHDEQLGHFFFCLWLWRWKRAGVWPGNWRVGLSTNWQTNPELFTRSGAMET